MVRGTLAWLLVAAAAVVTGCGARSEARPGPGCGNGLPDEREECDDGNENIHDGCTLDCLQAFCGDGYLFEARYGGNEQCDDGNRDDNDACRNDCTIAWCGDGVVFAGVEECDDGNDVADDGCTNTCEAN
jgi:cysteine-rich repeat protein